ncbi:MAG: endopeptidase La [Ignavibacteriales bacterium]
MLNPFGNTVPVLPIKNSVLFPYMLMPLVVSRPTSISAIEAALAKEDKILAIFTQKDASVEEPKADDLFKIGTLAVIKKMIPIEQTLHIAVQGVQRVELVGVTTEQPFLNATVKPLPELNDKGPEIEALHRAVLDLASKIVELSEPEMKVNLNYVISGIKNPLHQVYLLASLLSFDLEKEIAILFASTKQEVLQLMRSYLNHEIQVLELRNRISSEVQSEMGREQREYLLRQQLRAIQKELGERRPEESDAAELRERMKAADLPETVLKEAEKELSRLELMSSISPDYQMTRTYIQLIIELPWKKMTEDNLDLERAQQVLDEDHFNLVEVKQRIIEHLAVMKLNPNAKAPIICFVGPPGVGKTSLGQSIGRALGRKFERISLGGLHDEAELRGHRRTYIGAMPGRIIQAIHRAGYRNPLLMLDEVDKLGRDFRGDPAAALMEVLDPAQNFEFHDNYLNLPFDLSRVFFITTANTLDGIPRPLLDRMEVLRLAGYSDEEKREIARRYLVSRQIREAGLTSEQLMIADETLLYIIRRYTREAGVRELERSLGRIARKVAIQVGRGNTMPVTVMADNLFELLGPEKFFEEQARQILPPGVAAGLAWTESGGDVLYVEAVLLAEGKDLILTGQLGSVMQESAKTAQSYIRSHSDDLGIESELIRRSGVHIHVPAGAIPKDGPSAGVTMVTALASLYTRVPVRSDTAMTGEVTLSGLVLPVGGIKEKILAAHRAGIRRVIISKDNKKDLSEIPDHVRQEIQFIYAECIEDVLVGAIPKLAERIKGRAVL